MLVIARRYCEETSGRPPEKKKDLAAAEEQAGCRHHACIRLLKLDPVPVSGALFALVRFLSVAFTLLLRLTAAG